MPNMTNMPQEKESAIAEQQGYERRAWTIGEDEAIVRLVNKYGTKRWSIISEQLNKEAFSVERTGKQCRTR